MTPIEITFTRQLPTEPGLFLWQHEPGFLLRVREIKRAMSDGRLYDLDTGDDVTLIGGEWAGPLRIKSHGDFIA